MFAKTTMIPRMKIMAILFMLFLAMLSGSEAVGQSTMDPRGGFVGDMIRTYDGFTQPMHEIMVAADEMGRLSEVLVKVGQHVEAGQLIARLEDNLQLAAIKTAEIQANMKGELDAATVELELNQDRAEKLRRLAADGMARPDELRRAEGDLRIASARVASLEEQKLVRVAELERAEIQFQRRSVLAPAAGVISEVLLSPGEYISPSTPAIAELLVVDRLIAVFDVPVQEILPVAVGAKVRVRLRSTTRRIDAEITSITPKIDGESGTVQVRVHLANSDGSLLSGDRSTMEILEIDPTEIETFDQAALGLPLN